MKGGLKRATPATRIPAGGDELAVFRGRLRFRPPKDGRVVMEAETELGATLGLELLEEDLRGLQVLTLATWARLTGAGDP